ncbi:hypothetical protein VPH35_097818 [Triticum aestivum]
MGTGFFGCRRRTQRRTKNRDDPVENRCHGLKKGGDGFRAHTLKRRGGRGVGLDGRGSETRQHQMGGMVKRGAVGAIVRVWGPYQGEGNGWSVFQGFFSLHREMGSVEKTMRWGGHAKGGDVGTI